MKFAPLTAATVPCATSEEVARIHSFDWLVRSTTWPGFHMVAASIKEPSAKPQTFADRRSHGLELTLAGNMGSSSSSAPNPAQKTFPAHLFLLYSPTCGWLLGLQRGKMAMFLQVKPYSSSIQIVPCPRTREFHPKIQTDIPLGDSNWPEGTVNPSDKGLGQKAGTGGRTGTEGWDRREGWHLIIPSATGFVQVLDFHSKLSPNALSTTET